MVTRHTFSAAVGLVVLTSLVTGCVGAGYRLGSTLPKSIRTVYIPTVQNATREPSLEVDTTDAIIQEFQKDGALKVVQNASEADLLLEVTLTSYILQPLSYNRNDDKKADEYRIRLKAKVLCKNQKTNTILVSSKVEGKATFIPSGGMALSKREALPDAAEDLAHKVVQDVVEAW